MYQFNLNLKYFNKSLIHLNYIFQEKTGKKLRRSFTTFIKNKYVPDML